MHRKLCSISVLTEIIPNFNPALTLVYGTDLTLRFGVRYMANNLGTWPD